MKLQPGHAYKIDWHDRLDFEEAGGLDEVMLYRGIDAGKHKLTLIDSGHDIWLFEDEIENAEEVARLPYIITAEIYETPKTITWTRYAFTEAQARREMFEACRREWPVAASIRVTEVAEVAQV